MRSGRHWVIRAVLVVLGAALGALASAAPASAHAVLLRTSPGTGSIVQQAPDAVTLTFNEPVRLVSRDITVVAPNGKTVSGGPRRTGDGSVVRIPLHDELPHGTFLVSYRIISADSHPVAGGFSFSLGAPSKRAPAATGGTGATEKPVVAVAMPVARYLGYAGLVLLVGPALVLLSLWPSRLSRRGPARLIRLGLLLVGVSTLAEFLLQVPYSAGTGIADISGHGLATVLTSRFGWAHVVRAAVLLTTAPLLAVLTADRRNRLGVPERAVLGVLAAVGLGTWGFGGHPGTSPVPWLTVLADAVHLAAMAAWLGGLVMLVAFLLRRARASELDAVLPVWSRWATTAVAALAAAGVLQACLQLGSVSALWQTTYGVLLIVKVAAFAGILAVASSSRAAVRRAAVSARRTAVPVAAGGGDSDYGDTVWDEVYGERADAQAAGTSADGEAPADGAGADEGAGVRNAAGSPAAADPGGAAPTSGATPDGVGEPVAAGATRRRHRLRRLVLVELAVAVAVLGVTAVLVQTTPARSQRSVAVRGADLPYNKTLNTSLFSLQVEVDPAHTGRNTLHAIAFHRGNGRPVRVLGWHATARLPSAGIGPIDVHLKPITDNHAIADVALPRTGTWKFAITVRVSKIDEQTVTASVPVH